MGGIFGRSPSGAYMSGTKGISKPFGMAVGALIDTKYSEIRSDQKYSVYSEAAHRPITVSCFVGASGNVICETPTGDQVFYSLRGYLTP